MPNIASVLKEEIQRLARKELRSETDNLKKATATARAEISALKKRAASLEKDIAHLTKRLAAAQGQGPAPREGGKVRFSAKGLASRRKKLKLSAEEFGALIGVSAQTIYNWEAGKTRPREGQIEQIVAVRSMGKRQIKAKLSEGAAPEEASPKAPKAKRGPKAKKASKAAGKKAPKAKAAKAPKAPKVAKTPKAPKDAAPTEAEA